MAGFVVSQFDGEEFTQHLQQNKGIQLAQNTPPASQSFTKIITKRHDRYPHTIEGLLLPHAHLYTGFRGKWMELRLISRPWDPE